MRIYLFLTMLALVSGCSPKQDTGELVREIELLGGIAVGDEEGDITFVNLCSCEVTHSLIKKLCTFDRLKSLYLDYTDTDDKDLKYIGTIASLEILSINGTATTDKGLFHLLNLENLKTLNIGHYIDLLPESGKAKMASIMDCFTSPDGAPALSTEAKLRQEYAGEGYLALKKKYPKLAILFWSGDLPRQ